MTTKVFVRSPPNELLYDLLDKICTIRENHYYFDINAYAKLRYHEYHINFFRALRPYYGDTKKEYVERPLTYNNFTTILRQICKYNEIPFQSRMNYARSTYNIDYYVQCREQPADKCNEFLVPQKIPVTTQEI
jgi:hypothetical protein